MRDDLNASVTISEIRLYFYGNDKISRNAPSNMKSEYLDMLASIYFALSSQQFSTSSTLSQQQFYAFNNRVLGVEEENVDDTREMKN